MIADTGGQSTKCLNTGGLPNKMCGERDIRRPLAPSAICISNPYFLALLQVEYRHCTSGTLGEYLIWAHQSVSSLSVLAKKVHHSAGRTLPVPWLPFKLVLLDLSELT